VESESEIQRRIAREAKEAGEQVVQTAERATSEVLFAPPGTAAAQHFRQTHTFRGGNLWNQPRRPPINRVGSMEVSLPGKMSMELVRSPAKMAHGVAGRPPALQHTRTLVGGSQPRHLPLRRSGSLDAMRPAKMTQGAAEQGPHQPFAACQSRRSIDNDRQLARLRKEYSNTSGGAAPVVHSPDVMQGCGFPPVLAQPWTFSERRTSKF
jgi:hypothetical protein